MSAHFSETENDYHFIYVEEGGAKGYISYI